ncbi:MAG: hypothetical protein NZT92_01990 [Abditibacteriales bacterium]|nr:hypothetical protein [Abditibacteriales bacterium]MDW8364655.1 hypothetical protein [Abditibacteriales bacterium]
MRQQRSIIVNLSWVWERGQTAPWFLGITLTDPPQVKQLYRQRMRVKGGMWESKGHLKLSGLWRWQNLEDVRWML